jgi:predicted ATPase with chaperone activity
VSAAAAPSGTVARRSVTPEVMLSERLNALAPRPNTLAATGLTAEWLADLASKIMLRSGVMSASVLAERLGVAGGVLMDVLGLLRREARIEVRPTGSAESELCYTLTDRGRHLALDALHRDGYIGRAPVPLEDYARVVRAQAAHERRVNRTAMQNALQGVVVTDALRDRLGAALRSGRALFLYGPAGTGKTFIAGRLRRALPGEILIPHAIVVNGLALRIFDRGVHEEVDLSATHAPLRLNEGFDPRYACCHRPVLHVGGELEATMLDIELRVSTRELVAPLQLKANNGLLVIDDLGRQRSTTEQILNRWIVPMEDRIDHFSIGGGAYFSVPFDVVLVFSTNLKPETLTDDALRRRLGYKIAFGPISPSAYRRIWEQTCAALKLPFDQELVDYAIEELHGRRAVELLPVHPRDLLNMVVDRLRYEEHDLVLTRDLLIWAWDSNFFNSG